MIKYIPILLAFLISFVLMPLIIRFCNRKKIYDYVDERKVHSGNISRLGGIGIFVSYVICAFIYLLMEDELELSKTIPVFISASIIFVFGLLDDLYTFKAIYKLIAQLAACAIVTLRGFRFMQIFGWTLPPVLSYLLTFGWVLGLINAYNLIDGLDALCGNLSFTAILTLGLLFAFSGNYECGLCYILAAAIFGFLCWNKPPAKIFMGDEGSQFLGFMIAIIPLYTSGDKLEYNKFFTMIILTSLPIADTIAAIWRRLREHRPIMSPDKQHLHHKLLNMGYSKKGALIVITVLQSFLCLTTIAAFFVETVASICILCFSLVFVTVFFTVIHYSNCAVNDRIEKKEE